MKVKYSPGRIVSGIFLLPKKDRTFRHILNLKRFNEFVTNHHFKMDSLQTITTLVTPSCFMASNGLSCAPRQFTKIPKPPLATLHKQGHIYCIPG